MHDFHEPSGFDHWDYGDAETQRICEYVWENGYRVRWKGRNYPARVFRAGARFARKIIEDTTVILFGEDSRECHRFRRSSLRDISPPIIPGWKPDDCVVFSPKGRIHAREKTRPSSNAAPRDPRRVPEANSAFRCRARPDRRRLDHEDPRTNNSADFARHVPETSLTLSLPKRRNRPL